jgi:DNA primase catalytic core
VSLPLARQHEARPPRPDFAEVKERYPLIDVVERAGVQLRRSGTNRMLGSCPFHEDHTPSFFVYVDPQRFVCYGCKQRGDVFDFVRLHERLGTVIEARDWLTGTVPPPRRKAREAQKAHGKQERRWDRLTLQEQLVMNAAGALYRDALWRNTDALDYVRRRGIPDWVIRSCGLGYADGRSLEAYLRRHGGLRVAEELGLLRRPEQGEDGRPLRERFAGRVVIPEIRGGQPIWFIGRRPTDQESGRVKYLTPSGDKPVLGFERAIGQRRVFLIEGVFDWLTAVSWQLPAFSTCGTDFPQDRLGWLARADIVYGVLDADTAGREAGERFGAALGHRWQPVALPDGCDLNDLGCRPDGQALFNRLVTATREGGREDG